MKLIGSYFYGNKISDYGIKNKRLDYGTLAKAFDAVLNNDIMQQTESAGLGYWEMESGMVDNSEEIEALKEQIDDLESLITEDSSEEDDERTRDQINELQNNIDELEREQEDYPDIFQWYIVSDQGARILEEIGETVFYNQELDMYLWGVNHYGTSWDYVLTNVPCCCDDDQKV